MKRFYKKDGRLFLENGRSKLAVGFMGHFESPNSPGRVGKLLVIQNVVAASPGNPIQPGRLLAVSFPKSEVNRDKYTWGREEEFQIPVKIQLAESKRKDIQTALAMDQQN